MREMEVHPPIPPPALPVVLLVLARVNLGALSELLRAAAHLGCVLHGGARAAGLLRRATKTVKTAETCTAKKMAAEEIRAPPAPPLYNSAGSQSAPLSPPVP